MYNHPRLALLATAVFPIALPAFAQADQSAVKASTGSDPQSQIVVTATRSVLPANALPLTVEVIAKNELDQQVAISGSVTDAVATLTPSFSPTRQKLSGAGETLRGRSPLYAINGIPQSTPLRDGSRDGFTIDAFFVDRVELIYGSNALQGIGGTGGIVNQVTVGAPRQDGLSGRLQVQGSASDGFEGDGLGWKTAGLIQFRQGRFDATAGAAYERRGVYYDAQARRVGINLTQGETQDSSSLSLFGRFGYALSDTARLDLIASRFDLDGNGDFVAVTGNRVTELPTSAIRGTPPGEPAANLTESLALSLTDNALSGGNLMTQVFWNRSRDTFGGEIAPVATFQDAQIAPVGTLFDQSQNRSRKFGGKISYERAVPGLDALTVIAGFDALWDKTEQRLIATDRVWVPPTDFRSLAPFAQANLALFDKVVRLAGGIRHEDVRITIDDYTTLATSNRVNVSGGSPRFSATLFNGGVIVEPIPGFRAYASYAEGYTVPDVGRITRAVNRTGVDIDTFLDISPIVSNNREVGIELKKGPVDASATYFWSSSDNGQLLIARPDGIFDVQRQRVRLEGVELNLAVQMPVDGLRLSMGYAHLAGRYDSNGDDLVDTDLDGANISPDRLNLAASYVKGPISARIQAQFYLSRSFVGLLRDPRNDFSGYTLADASIRYETGAGALTLSVQNLFDAQYVTYASDTQRPTDNTFYFAGRGRTFTLGWDYRF